LSAAVTPPHLEWPTTMMCLTFSASTANWITDSAFKSECATTFEANPERYVSQATEASESADEPLEKHEPPYTTLGFLTSPKFGAAGSGGLEYERLPEAHDR